LRRNDRHVIGGNDEPITLDDRQARWLEIERQLHEIAEGKVVAGDPAATEARWLEELDELEWEAGQQYFMDRGPR
jgi:hypothetical protein